MERIALKQLLLAAGLPPLSHGQAASTLVYCSEASPAGFDPSRTPAHRFDASAETIQPPDQFKRGGTEVETWPGNPLGYLKDA